MKGSLKTSLWILSLGTRLSSMDTETAVVADCIDPDLEVVWQLKQKDKVPLLLWCWRRLLRVPWTARRSNQSILKEINPENSLEGLMLKLKLKLQYFGHLM